jgi:TIR domain
MATIWITYAWDDNKANDIDFVAQELVRSGLTVKLDRWNLGAGRRLWSQIENFICAPDESDAWLLIATNHSLASEPCKEEFAYALDRALGIRGSNFPIIALFLGLVDDGLIPAGVRTRLFVSITAPDWKERIVAAAEGRQHQAARPEIEPFYSHVHDNQKGEHPIAIEVRPRAGVWAPFIAAIPIAEKDMVASHLMIGPRDFPIAYGSLTNAGSGVSDDGQWWCYFAGNESTPTQSYYVWCKRLPTRLGFGVNTPLGPKFTITFR